MSVLKNLENKIAGLVEGTFSRAFKSEVRPVEIARKLAREMEEHKSYSLSRTYAPNEYRVFLSPQDRARFVDTEGSLAAEFSGYLLEHARRERLVLLSRPVVLFETDARLRLGEFGIQTSLVDPAQAAGAGGGAGAAGAAGAGAGAASPAPPPPAPAPRGVGGIESESGRTMVHSTAERVSEQLAEARAPNRATALLVMDGKRLRLGPSGVVLGRSRSSDVTVDDPNVSRAHAEVRPHGSSWVLSDLDSTNGTRLNGRRVTQPEVLKSGDAIEIGTTTLTFSLEP
jgi:hypothetical protein